MLENAAVFSLISIMFLLAQIFLFEAAKQSNISFVGNSANWMKMFATFIIWLRNVEQGPVPKAAALLKIIFWQHNIVWVWNKNYVKVTYSIELWIEAIVDMTLILRMLLTWAVTKEDFVQWSTMGHFQKYRNTLWLSSKILHKYGFCFLFGP